MGTTSATLERLGVVAAPAPVGAVTLHDEPRSAGPESARPLAAGPLWPDLLWKVWPGREWPASSAEEQALIADLHVRAAGVAPAGGLEPRRGDITALLNALRCGLEAPDLFARAPGLRPARLIAAHDALDAKRRAAVGAWHLIVSTPSVECVATWGDTAAALVPVVIGRLRDVRASDRAELEAVVAACAADIDRVGRLAASVEQDMSDPAVPPRRRTGLAALLFAGAGSGLWHHECYLAQRVGSLVPVRVAALLGENTAR
jgi:hypothetical protein